LVGQQVLAAVDLERMEAEMDRADELHEARMREAFANRPGGVTRWPCRTTVYRVGDDGKLAFDSGSEGPAWHVGDLDGDVIAQRVVRQRWSQ